MNNIRLTRRGWAVLIGAALLAVVGVNAALSGKCWNNNGFGYTTCAWAEGADK